MNLKKLALWGAVIAVVYHFYKNADEKAKAQAAADALDEDIFDPQD